LEKDCLNCNAEVLGRYCQVCGQENIPVAQSTWHIVTHFFNDLTHFDGKFFSTVRYLVFKPGFVSNEYVRGRRVSYLDPIRMYLFTSAIFFLVFFQIFKVDEDTVNFNTKINGKTESEISSLDSAEFANATALMNAGKPMSRAEFKKKYEDTAKLTGLQFTGTKYTTKKAYDSILAKGIKKHNWLQRTLVYKEIELNKKYNNDKSKIISAFLQVLTHSFPQMLFISLPLFALALKLLYIRRKNFVYTNHLIFSVHLYIFVFIILLVIIGLRELNEVLHWEGFSWIMGLLYAFIFFYEYKAMRVFYKQGRGKTILKYILLNNLHLFIMVLLFLIFTFFSFLKI
jgi:hypothetical protein